MKSFSPAISDECHQRLSVYLTSARFSAYQMPSRNEGTHTRLPSVGSLARLTGEQRIQKAIQYILNSHTRVSIRTAAKLFHVPRSTLGDRISRRHVPPKEAHGDQQLLPPLAEQSLLQWCDSLAQMGHPLSRRTIVPYVRTLTGNTPGKHWLERFLNRHDSLKMGRPSRLDPERARSFNRPTVMRHFELLKKKIDENEIPWENVYNMDEKGVQLGGGRKNDGRKYIISRRRRRQVRTASDNLELVTVIECVSANGKCIDPGFIFKGKRLNKVWYSNANLKPGWCVNSVFLRLFLVC